LAAGPTLLSVSLEGYISQRVEVEVFGGEPHWHSFALEPLSDPDPAPDSGPAPAPDSGLDPDPGSGQSDGGARSVDWDGGNPEAQPPAGSGGGVEGELREGSVGCVLGGSPTRPWLWLRRWR